jgi:hypothetical protein
MPKSMLKPLPAPKKGDLKVWWIPQVPMGSFDTPVKNLDEAKLLLRTLARYDIFQFENRVKPDYCNAGGLSVFNQYGDGEWTDWYNEEGDGIDDVMRAEDEQQDAQMSDVRDGSSKRAKRSARS